ncbi:class I SAM-dependent methyltransferase [Amnibacterium sp.]|uniref:class I SAM-dependent methyltransferase n=1 Tax=Amnibacterium sp. TaxID=1872496 RepID=UPI00261E7D63|nr:class I SAM-dependent methyltransferase [Amnibacterium sp.]MCU1474668.1 SAM-dependent methyltransferase [Amnibacterium sp.]
MVGDAFAMRARSFGGAADAYATGRPTYPGEAVAWLVAGVRRVVDVGAGTGKLTTGLLAAGCEVVAAVDPDPGMLATLEREVPGVPVLVGTAESVPLPDGSVDAAVLGQAWHWVDPEAASAELGRVVRPGGVLGLLWNIRDEGVPWVAELGAIMHGSAAEQMIDGGAVHVAAPFGPLAEHRVTWSVPRTPDEIVALAASRSYLIALPEDDRAAVLERIRDLLAAHPATTGRDRIDLPYVTYAFRAVRD